MRQYMHWLGQDSFLTIHRNAWWMGWNLLLALIPALLSVLLFHRQHRHGAVWWCGVALFVAFLPNAPYVVTDLIHLPDAITATHLTGTVLVAVLPAFATLVLAGLACYALAISELVRELRRDGMARWTRSVEVLVHLAAAVGVLLGRVVRLNSWTPIAHPRWSALRTAALLSEPSALALVVVLAIAFALAHHLITGVGRAAIGWAGPHLPGSGRGPAT
ncbi:MAG: hypothetical protein JWN46_2543 [Acidimicrobiales bacterium]|nr:hypothetical protein [Acidimicrobiales bacterium]